LKIFRDFIIIVDLVCLIVTHFYHIWPVAFIAFTSFSILCRRMIMLIHHIKQPS
jgi:hypothetical protein